MSSMRLVRGGWRARAASALALSLVGAAVVTAGGNAKGRAPGVSIAPVASKAHAAETFGSIPVSFEPNVGQSDSDADFVARGAAARLTATGAVLTGGTEPVTLAFVGAARSAHAVGGDELPGKVNYLRGADPSRWLTNVPTYGSVRYEQLYPGVDLVWYGNGRSLEYDLVVTPGADPDAVSFELTGAEAPEVAPDGALVAGRVRFARPVAYQVIDGARRTVASRYELHDGGRVGFRLGDYDRRLPLVVDPEIDYAFTVGESGKDIIVAGIAVDATGAAYAVGSISTGSTPLDVYVAKVNPEGTALVYATMIGGSNTDQAFDVAVDTAGNVYITGETLSSNFPTTTGAFQTAIGSGGSNPDAIVVKVGPAGDALVYSSFLGGNDFDNGRDVVVDGSGNAYVAGTTNSTNFPTTSAAQPSLGGGTDAFVTKLNPTGTATVYSTYLGGSEGENGEGIALDASGNVYVVGATTSSNFPVSAGALQPTLGGGFLDGFWARYDAAGQRAASTYLGGSDDDLVRAVAVDGSGASYLTGETSSTDFPLVAPFQSTIAGVARDAFVAELNPAGTALGFSSFYGGSQYESGFAVAVTGGIVSVAGETYSTDFPTVDPVQPSFGGGLSDVFVLEVATGAAAAGSRGSGPSVKSASFLGGLRAELVPDGAVDAKGAFYVSSARPDLSPDRTEDAEGTITKYAGGPPVPRPDLKVIVAAISFLRLDGVPSAIVQVIVRSTTECNGPKVPNATFSLDVPVGLGVTDAAPGSVGVRVVSLPPADQPGRVVFQLDRPVEDDGTDRGTVVVAIPDSGTPGPVQLEAFAETTGVSECTIINNRTTAVIDVGKRVFQQGKRLLELDLPVDTFGPPTILLVNNAAPAGPQPPAAVARGSARAFNVYTSTQPNVQPVPSNLLVSVPPNQTSVDVSTTPGGSFFVVTTVTDTGESDPSNEVGGELPTVTKLKVSASKVVVQGMGFAADVRVLFGGLPFATAPKLKRNNTKIVQKAPLVTGQSLGDFTALLLGGSKVVVLVVNGNGNAVAVEYTR